MNTRTPARRVDEKVVNGGVPHRVEKLPQCVHVPQDEQVPITNQGNELPVVPQDMTNEEVRGALVSLAPIMTSQTNRDVGPYINTL